MQDASTGQEAFAQLYARAKAARAQTCAYQREFIAGCQTFKELRQEFTLARKRAETARDLWLNPRRDGQLPYTPQARMVARLASMPVIEQAKGIIMAQYGWSADQAFDALRQASQHSNIKVRVLAAQVVASTTDSPRPPARRPSAPRPPSGAVIEFRASKPSPAVLARQPTAQRRAE